MFFKHNVDRSEQVDVSRDTSMAILRLSGASAFQRG